jgi:hypothetical protein
MPPVDASRNLLFGLLALQNNFIDRDALLDAFNRWTRDKVRPLGEILFERAALTRDEFALLDALVAKRLERFANDPQKSLAALTSIGSVREDRSRIDPLMAAFDARLRAIVKDEQRPKDVDERLQFAQRADELT